MFKLTTIKKSKLIRDNGVLFFSGVMTGAVNYALYPLISRSITVEQFGEVQILLSLMLQLSVASSVIRVFIVNSLKDEEDAQVIGQFLRNTARTMLMLATAITVFFLAAAPFLKDALQFESIYSLIPAAVAVVISFQFMIPLAYLQAKQQFEKVSILQFGQALTKLLIGGLFGFLGGGSIGVVWGVVIAAFLMLLYAKKQTHSAFYPLNAVPNEQRDIKSKFAWKALKKHLAYIFLISASLVSVIVLLSLDTFIVKLHFSPEDAGLYAGVAVAARTLFYLTASVSAVLLSAVKSSNPHKKNLTAYLSSMAILGLISAAALLVILIFSERIIGVLIGSEYLQYSSLLPRLSLAMTFVGFANVIINYHVALKEKYIVIPSVLGLGAVALLLFKSSDSLQSVATGFLQGAAFMLALLSVWSIYWNTHSRYR